MTLGQFENRTRLIKCASLFLITLVHTIFLVNLVDDRRH